MKYKQEYWKIRRNLVRNNLLYVLNKIQTKKLLAENEALAAKIPAPTNQLPGNRKTKINYYTNFSNFDEWMAAHKVVEKLAPLNIVDEINIEIPLKFIRG